MPRTEDAAALYRLGEEAARGRDWRRAAELFGQAADAEPANAAYRLAFAQSLQLAGMDALAPFQRASLTMIEPSPP